jgi:hypothetical protein
LVEPVERGLWRRRWLGHRDLRRGLRGNNAIQNHNLTIDGPEKISMSSVVSFSDSVAAALRNRAEEVLVLLGQAGACIPDKNKCQ